MPSVPPPGGDRARRVRGRDHAWCSGQPVPQSVLLPVLLSVWLLFRSTSSGLHACLFPNSSGLRACSGVRSAGVVLPVEELRVSVFLALLRVLGPANSVRSSRGTTSRCRRQAPRRSSMNCRSRSASSTTSSLACSNAAARSSSVIAGSTRRMRCSIVSTGIRPAQPCG